MKRIGKRTLIFEKTPVIKGYASVAGRKEYEGPLGKFFDRIIYDPYNGMETFEDAESSFQAEAVSLAIEKSGVTTAEIDYIFAGDLLNQCTGSSFGIRDFQLPFLGQYGACSTMGQGLIMSAVFTDSGAARNAVCATSSHFCAAERQYRFPLEYGSVRTPTAQWTVTGAGSCVVGRADSGVSIAAATVGKITDYQVTDPNNMGAAMAPAICIIRPRVTGATQSHRQDGQIFVCPLLKSSATRQGCLRFCRGQSKICSAYPYGLDCPCHPPECPKTQAASMFSRLYYKKGGFCYKLRRRP